MRHAGTHLWRNPAAAGFTLLELVIVLGLLALIAAIAVPDLSASDNKRLQLAAEEFAEAMRFARREALRTGTPYGFAHDTGNLRIRVFRGDTSTTPLTPTYDVYHPIDKQLYDKNLGSHSVAGVNSISATSTFQASCTASATIYFDANGTPWCSNPQTALLDELTLTFVGVAQQKRVQLDRITGRVTVN